MKKNIFSICLLLYNFGVVLAQIPTEGVTYFLPKTALRFSLLIEKTTFTPGQYACYSEKYLKKQVKDVPTTTYRIVKLNMDSYAIPDSSKQFTATIDKKHSLVSVQRDKNGVIMAVNAKAEAAKPIEPFEPTPQPAPIDPTKYMTAEMLAAGSNAKTAELIAQEIYDIRDSKNQLSRGEAEFMPKDGAQLKLMLNNLNTQEKALLQFFEGTTQVDTVETFVDYVPSKDVDKALLFRFSHYLGMVDNDDLGGIPYYIKVLNQKVIPTLKLSDENKKKDKNNVGINVNLPGKIKIVITKEEKPFSTFETYAAQYGNVENISGKLWSKKLMTYLVLDAVTGNVISIKTEEL